MICPQCNQAVDANASFCGYCGKQLAPINLQSSPVSNGEKAELYSGSQWRPSSANHKGFPAVSWEGMEESPVKLSQDTPPYASRPSSAGHRPVKKRRFNTFVSVLIVLLLIGLSAGFVALAQNGHPRFPLAPLNSAAANGAQGSILFSASPGQEQTDTISAIIKGLQAPSQGSQYDVWLVDEQAEHTHLMGTLNASGNNFVLNSTQSGINLLGEGNEITITQETANVLSPTNKPLLIARFPPLAFIHIRHLLYHFDSAPQGIALLVGLQEQSSLVNKQAQLLQQTAEANDTADVRCAAQNLLNLLEGDQGLNFQQLPAGCQQNNLTQPGDGFGLLGQDTGYIEMAAAHASLAATAPDATATVKTHATKVENALSNIKGWLMTVDNDALVVLNHPDDSARIQEIVTQASNAYNGIHTNNNNLTDPPSGDAGVATALLQGRLMASLVLQPS
jgi:hypothetical protein